ncbi:MAG TPA: HoxN/HupN/NixA family nickel/cobalt transporter [Candidatus Saccharimonadales bacterium]|nr:HoxN/HupN/NixA family nickel/cobalt transporter [Candidatus Saccharimonadales bacterium]
MIGLTRTERAKIILVYLLIGIATAIGFLASAIVGKLSVLLAGLGIITYVFGLRHGVDADHIAAIDNTTRKLMQENKRPFTVGLWFSLGHSTIVVALTVGLVVATRTIVGHISVLESGGAVIGTMISGLFLWLMGIVNLVILLSIYRIFKELKRGRLNQSELDNLLDNRGFLNRYFRPLFKIVKHPWQIYPIGVLFGLGFDTATEVALVAISVGIGVSSSVPVWMILVLPFMFTCGMVLIDTTDGVTMRVAYGWAFLNPIRKIYYNLTVTVISVLVALAIGSAELLQVMASELNLTGTFWGWLDTLDFESIGLGIIIIFIATWLGSAVLWKYKRLDELNPYNRITSE